MSLLQSQTDKQAEIEGELERAGETDKQTKCVRKGGKNSFNNMGYAVIKNPKVYEKQVLHIRIDICTHVHVQYIHTNYAHICICL